MNTMLIMVPRQRLGLTLQFWLGRVVAVAGRSVGRSLPTKLNYLARCLQDGFTYRGIVTASSNGSNPQVQADFVAA